MTKPIKIAIWGTSRAGKTVYLIALFWDFQRLHGEWAIRAADAESEAFLDSAREDIFVHHRFPDKTTSLNTYRYYLTRKVDRREFLLEFIDAPGELYAEYYDPSLDKQKRTQRVSIARRDKQPQQSEQTPNEIFDQLKESDGILTLLDPGWKLNPLRNQPYDQLLAQVFRDLRNYSQTSTTDQRAPYVALCYTKIDATTPLWEFVKQHYDGARNPNGFNPLRHCYRFLNGQGGHGDDNPCQQGCKIYEELGSKLMEDQLELPREHFACFHLSSIGRVGDRPNVGSVSQWERDEILALKPPVFHADTEGDISLPPSLADFAQPLDDIYVDETFEPLSINKPNDIAPYRVTDPVLWLIEQVDQYAES